MRPLGYARIHAVVSIWLLTLAFALSAVGQGAMAGEAKSIATPQLETVRYQVDAYYPPYTFENDRFLYGFDPYLTNIIFTSSQYKLAYSTDTWEKVYSRIVSGQIDLAGIIAVTEQRSREVLFSDMLFNSYVSIYTVKDYRNITLDELPALHIGVGKGYYTEGILRDTLGITTYHAYENIATALGDLLNGDIDVIFENQQLMDNILIQQQLKGSIVAQITNLYPQAHAYAISKQRPELAVYINERIRRLKQSGFFEEIYEKYFYRHSEEYTAALGQRVMYLILAGLAVIAALFILMQMVIRRLRHRLKASLAGVEAANEELARANDELKARFNEIRAIAYTNAVTGLPNKNAFREALNRMIDAGRTERISILYLDLDNFKDVNDTFGHDTGDKVLRAITLALQGYGLPEGSLYNIGADEYAVMLADITRQQAEVHMKGVLQTIEKPINLSGNVFHITASMGVAFYPEHGRTFDMLLKNADAAMYRAKGTGSGLYMMFDEAIGKAVLERTRLQSSLRNALDKNEFLLDYQPQINTLGEGIYGFEALIRWKRPGVGVVAPSEFIGEAEESRLIVPIGQWVLEHACRFVRHINETCGARFQIAVNVSIIQLLREDYIDTVLQTLRDTGLEPNCLELEITESCLLVETELVIGKLKRLNQAGVKIALDDFGTGYSSLRYLKDLPVHVLKIDRYFIDSIASGKSRSLVQAIVAIGHALGLTLVAEGVETGLQLKVMRELACDRIQGYLYSKPIAEDAVLGYINHNRDRVGKG